MNPSGKLPSASPALPGRSASTTTTPTDRRGIRERASAFPTTVDAPHTPRYPFGHGLSYTSFEYSALQLSSSEIGPTTGSTSVFASRTAVTALGEETVQLYVSDRYASLSRPVQGARRLQKVHLARTRRRPSTSGSLPANSPSSTPTFAGSSKPATSAYWSARHRRTSGCATRSASPRAPTSTEGPRQFFAPTSVNPEPQPPHGARQ